MRVLAISAMAGLAAAQVTYSNGTYICAKPGAAYCAGSSLGTDIIIRCDENRKGTPGRCTDNLAGQPPLGVNPALCWQKDETSGIAACEKNCVVYGSSGTYDGTFTLGSDVCTPYSTQPTATPTPTESCTDFPQPTETETCTDEPEPTEPPEPTESCTDFPQPTETETCTDEPEPTEPPEPTESCTDEPEPTEPPEPTESCTDEPEPTEPPEPTESCTDEPEPTEPPEPTESCTDEPPKPTGTGGTITYHPHPTGGHNTGSHNTTITTITTPCETCHATNVPPTPTTSIRPPVVVNGGAIAGKATSGALAGLVLLFAVLL